MTAAAMTDATVAPVEDAPLISGSSVELVVGAMVGGVELTFGEVKSVPLVELEARAVELAEFAGAPRSSSGWAAAAGMTIGVSAAGSTEGSTGASAGGATVSAEGSTGVSMEIVSTAASVPAYAGAFIAGASVVGASASASSIDNAFVSAFVVVAAGVVAATVVAAGVVMAASVALVVAAPIDSSVPVSFFVTSGSDGMPPGTSAATSGSVISPLSMAVLMQELNPSLATSSVQHSSTLAHISVRPSATVWKGVVCVHAFSTWEQEQLDRSSPSSTSTHHMRVQTPSVSEAEGQQLMKSEPPRMHAMESRRRRSASLPRRLKSPAEEEARAGARPATTMAAARDDCLRCMMFVLVLKK
mmetsp:Transcript_16349/g.35567  ORF Transcript_16349/g.35567 Transcript_16349/m.35567 type:complete len:358 (+) Transcript_16349:194-1267(+)